MKHIKSFADANKALAEFITKGSSETPYTLDRMRALMKALGDPQEKVKTVHVAGTSGKTSTCYYIADLLQSAGLKTGLSVSPHVAEINERVQTNGIPLAESTYCHDLEDFLNILSAQDIRPSYFELLVAFAFWEFDRQKVDVAVIEVGLGGLLDGTNVIVRPDKTCVITDIGFDHTEILGKTLTEIAGQKAGIIHEGNSVFMNEQEPAAMKVVSDTCDTQLATLCIADTIDMSLALAPFQERNLRLAVATVNHVLHDTSKPELGLAAIQNSGTIPIPGRMETYKISDKTIILDGSHNAQKIHALATGIDKLHPNVDAVLVVSIGNNKIEQIETTLQALRNIGDVIFLTKFSLNKDISRHAIDPQHLSTLCQKAGFTHIRIDPDPLNAFEQALKTQSRLIVVTGSFFLLNHIRPYVLARHVTEEEKR